MESRGLNIFNDQYLLASPGTATDMDYAYIEAVVAHEYFHNWTGNRVTCRDWFQLCLKEGLTIFRHQEFSADQRSRAVERISDVRILRSQQFVEDAGPLAHPVRPQLYHEINNFFTTTVYNKGGEIVRMIRTLLGADVFRKSMDLYFARHDGQAVTVDRCERPRLFPVHALVHASRHAGDRGHAALRCARPNLPARRRSKDSTDARPAY